MRTRDTRGWPFTPLVLGLDQVPRFGPEGRLIAMRRTLVTLATTKIGELDSVVRARIERATDADQLERLVIEVGVAPDPALVEELLGRL